MAGAELTVKRDRLVGKPREGCVRIRRGVDRHAIDGQHIVAFADFDPGLGQRRADIGTIPRSAADDMVDSVGIVFKRPVDAEQPYRPSRCVLGVTTTDVGVGGIHFGDEFADDDVDVPPRDSVVEERAVLAAKVRPNRARGDWHRRNSRGRFATPR